MQQLLWLETLLKFFPGLLLTLAPVTTARVLGLPRSDGGFWLRSCGALLLGLAAALFLEGTSAGHGLGLAGAVVVNLCGIAVLAAALVLERGPSSVRGRVAVWLTVCVLLTLVVFEIALL